MLVSASWSSRYSFSKITFNVSLSLCPEIIGYIDIYWLGPSFSLGSPNALTMPTYTFLFCNVISIDRLSTNESKKSHPLDYH